MLQVSTSIEGRISPSLRDNFARLLAPRTMAFIGGGQVEATLKTLHQQDYAGDVYVVNPRRREIGGYKCVPSIGDLPVSPDAVFLAVNADATIKALRELSAVKAGGVVCYASGFSEIGASGFERNLAFVEASGDMAVVVLKLLRPSQLRQSWHDLANTLPKTAFQPWCCSHFTKWQRYRPFGL